MLTVIENYNILRKALPRLLEVSGYRMDYLAEQMGISKNYFYTKKSKNTFSNEEFEKIIAFIWRDEFQDILDEELMKQKMAEGRNLTGKEFKQKMGWL
jgi:hypothetical protein